MQIGLESLEALSYPLLNSNQTPCCLKCSSTQQPLLSKDSSPPTDSWHLPLALIRGVFTHATWGVGRPEQRGLHQTAALEMGVGSSLRPLMGWLIHKHSRCSSPRCKRLTVREENQVVDGTRTYQNYHPGIPSPSGGLGRQNAWIPWASTQVDPRRVVWTWQWPAAPHPVPVDWKGSWSLWVTREKLNSS